MLIYSKTEKIILKDHPEFNETWLRDIIKKDPAILGLGDLEVKDFERRQPTAGRIDLVLQDSEAAKRYEVEIMLGTVDASHIVRCIEYWDIERKRYQAYDHTAVLIAEDITMRFLNVIGLFSNSIPMIAIQLNALKCNNTIHLCFTKVLDEIIPGEDDEEDDGKGITREDWEKKCSKNSLQIADACLQIVQEFDAKVNLKYNENYIGLADGSSVRNYVIFKAKKNFVRVEAKISEQQQWIDKLEDAEIIVLPGHGKRKRIHFRLKEDEIEKHHDLLKDLFLACYQERQDLI